MTTTEKLAEEIGNCVRKNITWANLPRNLKQVLQNNQRDYEKYVFNYSIKNQLRFRGNLVAKVFRHEQRYYELLVQKSTNCLCLFPYHLADILTKGLRVTPFNYYLDVLSQLLRNDKSYDTLPNFIAADCLRILGFGRNEYLALISELKTHASRRTALFSAKPNPLEFLPRFPVRIRIEPWWRIELGYVLVDDIRFVNSAERSLIDDLIDFGATDAGNFLYELVHGLYRKGLIYLDVPIAGEDRICIPPLRNFVMNRVSGDYTENLLYKIFLSADEHMTIAELAQMLQIDLETVKQAVSLICRLGFAQRKPPLIATTPSMPQKPYHPSWEQFSREPITREPPQITPLNYNSYIMSAEGAEGIAAGAAPESSPKLEAAALDKDSSSIGYLSSDGNNSDFSFANMPSPSPQQLPDQQQKLQQQPADNRQRSSDSEPDELSECTTKLCVRQSPPAEKTGKRVGFLFDSTLTAFLMMGNLSPGLKNHAVTMFEVGKLCEESMDTFLTELEKVSLLDAEGEGDVSRYFAHAVILRSTICSLRNLLPGGLDLLRLECLECLDQKTCNRILEKKYKFIISATPLTATLSHLFSIPFFGQFYCSADNTHMWTKIFYNHISGYGPPSLFLCRGTVLKTLPRIFLGYGKLLVNILHSDSYVLNSENFRNINDQLRNGCVLVQGYGIRQAGDLRYEAFPFDRSDAVQLKWSQHKALSRLSEHLDLQRHCGYITFLNTGVPDIGCDTYELAVRLRSGRAKAYNAKKIMPKSTAPTMATTPDGAVDDILSPASESAELTSFARSSEATIGATMLKSPDENYFAVSSPQTNSPSNVYTSADCKELLATEIAKCDAAYNNSEPRLSALVSQSSVEIPIGGPHADDELDVDSGAADPDSQTETWTLLDVNFGVPLFDVDCNTRICERIVRQLCHEDNLQAIGSSATTMQQKFQNFVQQCMHFEGEERETKASRRPFPQPRINLAFENGRICYWSGR